MSFAHPETLWLILLLPLIALAGWWSTRRRRAALARFAGGPEHVQRFLGEVSLNRRAAKLLLLYLALERPWLETIKLALVVGVPFVVWQGILWVWLGALGVGAGGDMATSFEALPFWGLLSVATVDWRVFWVLLAILGPLFVLPALWALVVSVRDMWRGRRHPWVTVLLFQAAVLPFLPNSTWREPLAMARLAVGLVAATMLYGALRRSRRILNYSFFWLATLALLVNESALPV